MNKWYVSEVTWHFVNLRVVQMTADLWALELEVTVGVKKYRKSTNNYF